MKPHGPILIVDGDEGLRTRLADVLGNAGYMTREASAGDEGLQAARREPPSMVVLEVCLEGLSGYEVCRQLRDEFGDALPVVFVSADRAESHDRVAGFLVGGDDFLVKPFALDEFLARVRRLLERAEGRRDPPLESPLTGREVQVLASSPRAMGATRSRGGSSSARRPSGHTSSESSRSSVCTRARRPSRSPTNTVSFPPRASRG